MTTKHDYYDALGVSRSATEEEIRKAFRKKALEYHPDRNKDPGASERFQEVNEAYQVLTDPQKRAQYDRFGHAGLGSQQGQGFDPSDLIGGYGSIFDAFFGNTRGRGGRSYAGSDLETTLQISFSEAAFGVTKEVPVNRMETCKNCKGSRSEPGYQPQTCPNCNGSGHIRRTQRSLFGNFVQQVICNVCSGMGQVVSHPCSRCRGSGKENHSRQIKVDVPAGVANDIRIQLRGEGNSGEHSAPSGDLYINLQVEPHGLFQRSGNDILYNLDLTFPQVALGDEIVVPTLEGEVALKVPAGTQTGTVFRLKGKGIPHLGKTRRRGDELITVNISTPTNLDAKQKQLLMELRQSLTGENGVGPKRNGN